MCIRDSWNDDPIIRRELEKHGLKAHPYPFAAVKEDGAIAYVEDGEVEINEPIAFNMEQEELALRGTHNLYNSLAAGISANLAGIRKEDIRKALSDFKGVEHRLDWYGYCGLSWQQEDCRTKEPSL